MSGVGVFVGVGPGPGGELSGYRIVIVVWGMAPAAIQWIFIKKIENYVILFEGAITAKASIPQCWGVSCAPIIDRR